MSVVTRRARSTWPSPPVIPSSVSPVSAASSIRLTRPLTREFKPGPVSELEPAVTAARKSKRPAAAGPERGKVYFDARRDLVDPIQRRVGCPLLHVAHGHAAPPALAPFERGDFRLPRGRRLPLPERGQLPGREAVVGDAERAQCRVVGIRIGRGARRARERHKREAGQRLHLCLCGLAVA